MTKGNSTGDQSAAAANEAPENPSIEEQDPMRALMAGEDQYATTPVLHTSYSTQLSGRDLRQVGASQQAQVE